MNASLPAWAGELALLYESHATNQFVLYGNVDDDFSRPESDPDPPGGLEDFLLQSLLTGFDVVLTYDLGNGLRVLKGNQIFSQWRGARRDDGRPARAAVRG